MRHRLVELAIEMHDAALTYLVELQPTEAAAWAEAVGAWQPWQGGPVPVVEAANRLIPRKVFGPDNPNTGRPHHTFRAGREYSTVIYVDIIAAYIVDGRPVDVARRVIEAAQPLARADECDILPRFAGEDVDAGASVSIRFWWD